MTETEPIIWAFGDWKKADIQAAFAAGVVPDTCFCGKPATVYLFTFLDGQRAAASSCDNDDHQRPFVEAAEQVGGTHYLGPVALRIKQS
tara:strand:- start:841 stop:1107 length:267 start_codon:yes stop_codon:yes gene_type:complete